MKSVEEFFNNPIIKMIKKVISWIALGLLILIAAFLMFYIISSKFYEAKGQKFDPKVSLYTIISPSMQPSINVYDVVLDAKVDTKTIKEGDVITFISSSSLSEGMTITHRVVGIVETESGRKFRVKGDNNATADSSLVDESKVLGKVMFKLPQVGRIQFILQSKGGWLFALLIPALFIVLYDIIKVVRLSSAKGMIEESLKEEEEDKELKAKEEQLKKRLKNKFIGVMPVEPIIQTVDDDEDEEETVVVPKKKVKRKEKVVKEDDINGIEKETYNQELRSISRSKKKVNETEDSDALLEQILANSKRRKTKKTKETKEPTKTTKSTKKSKLDDYDIKLDLADIYKNIEKLNSDDKSK